MKFEKPEYEIIFFDSEEAVCLSTYLKYRTTACPTDCETESRNTGYDITKKELSLHNSENI